MRNDLYKELQNAIIEKTESCQRSEDWQTFESAKDSLKRLSQIVELLKIDKFLTESDASNIQSSILNNINFLIEKRNQAKRNKY